VTTNYKWTLTIFHQSKNRSDIASKIWKSVWLGTNQFEWRRRRSRCPAAGGRRRKATRRPTSSARLRRPDHRCQSGPSCLTTVFGSTTPSGRRQERSGATKQPWTSRAGCAARRPERPRKAGAIGQAPGCALCWVFFGTIIFESLVRMHAVSWLYFIPQSIKPSIRKSRVSDCQPNR